MIDIYIASAGSGKTYTLVKKYLCIAFKSDFEYKSIQAVTFTNKSTVEMKERIITELDLLSRRPEESNYLDDIIQESNLKKPSEVQARAKQILRSILENYSSFRVSTIDSFFQEVLRGFTRELDLKGGYQIELNTDHILDQASKQVLITLQNKRSDSQEDADIAELKEWVRELIFKRIDEGQGHNPYSTINKLSRELKKESVQELINNEQLPTLTDIKKLKHRLEQEIPQHFQHIKEIAAKILDYTEALLRDTSIPLDRETGIPINYKKSGGFAPFFKIVEGIEVNDYTPSRYRAIRQDISNLLGAKDKKTYGDLLENSLLPSLLIEYEDILAQNLTAIQTKKAIVAELPSYGLISNINQHVQEITKGEKSLLLSSTTSLINKILQEDASFIYEKLGVRLKHIMIDEFQDTSKLQYNNFKPLLEEANAQHEYSHSLIVGDAKQSIYRWRSAESSLLTQSAPYDFNTRASRLENNWRSLRAIIEFNNKLYTLLPDYLSKAYREMLATYIKQGGLVDSEEIDKLTQTIDLIKSVYHEAAQTIPTSRTAEGGAVVIHEYTYLIRSDKGEADYYLNESHEEEEQETGKEHTIWIQLPEVIDNLQQRGCKPNSIAILVRDKKEAAYVSNILTYAKQRREYAPHTSFDFVSEEALAPTKIISIDFILAALKLLVNPRDLIALYEVCTLYTSVLDGYDQDFNLKTKLNETESKEDVAYFIYKKIWVDGHKSLFEAIEYLIAEYKDLFPKEEYPYLIKFLDTAFSYQQDRSKDIADFIEMWKEQAEDLRVDIPEDESKIKIMTIHKSKGLEFDAVLLPFLEWSLVPNPKQSNFIWCNNPYQEEGSNIPNVPIKLNKALLNSHFAPNFIEESIKTTLDALNLCYVATTRAKQELHLWARPTGKHSINKLKEDSNLSDIHCSIMGLLNSQLDALQGLYIDRAEGEALPQLAALQTKVKLADKKTSKLYIERLQSFDIQGRIEELHKGLSYFDKESNRNFGIVMHKILSEMEYAEDKDLALERAIQRGDLNRTQEKDARQRLELLLSDHNAERWFGGHAQVLNEVAILGDTQQYRPDRIMIYPDNSVEIVDYKFGIPKDEHRVQVLNYGALLRKIGYSKVFTYLWYISDDEAQPPFEVYS